VRTCEKRVEADEACMILRGHKIFRRVFLVTPFLVMWMISVDRRDWWLARKGKWYRPHVEDEFHVKLL